ncbi:hypothetical protein SCFA_1020012 [anaerobic digester metagenome]|jgi:hypothetical protein|uniref:Uncharacterized protein n=1 Tax=anaerobic digester metagenome TaxID=1263854 RepID=A0A485LUT7_9ZZZZ
MPSPGSIAARDAAGFQSSPKHGPEDENGQNETKENAPCQSGLTINILNINQVTYNLWKKPGLFDSNVCNFHKNFLYF